MTRIQIDVRKGDEGRASGAVLKMLSGAFTLGIIVGMIITSAGQLPFPENASQNVASVIGSDTIVTPSTQSVTTDNTPPENISDEFIIGGDESLLLSVPLIIPTDGIVLGDNTPTQDTPDIQSEDRDIAVERLSREIARLKDASVELITEFNQNCGAWNDLCATPYISLLEKNNTTYDALARELEILLRIQ